jgi:hypothetical protein
MVMRTLFSDVRTSGCGALRALRLVELNPKENGSALTYTYGLPLVGLRLGIFDIMGTDGCRGFVSMRQFISILQSTQPLCILMMLSA